MAHITTHIVEAKLFKRKIMLSVIIINNSNHRRPWIDLTITMNEITSFILNYIALCPKVLIEKSIYLNLMFFSFCIHPSSGKYFGCHTVAM